MAVIINIQAGLKMGLLRPILMDCECCIKNCSLINMSLDRKVVIQV